MKILGGKLYFFHLKSHTAPQYGDVYYEKIVAESNRFWKSEKKYVENKLPYKRGILLHGPQDLETIYNQHGHHHITNILDGSNSIYLNKVLILATTNRLDELPPEITNRPSRFDILIKVDLPTKKMREAFLDNHPIPVCPVSFVKDTGQTGMPI